jgi:hypothetical protein
MAVVVGQHQQRLKHISCQAAAANFSNFYKPVYQRCLAYKRAETRSSDVQVIGVGGCGGQIVSKLWENGAHSKLDLLLLNTDMQVRWGKSAQLNICKTHVAVMAIDSHQLHMQAWLGLHA